MSLQARGQVGASGHGSALYIQRKAGGALFPAGGAEGEPEPEPAAGAGRPDAPQGRRVQEGAGRGRGPRGALPSTSAIKISIDLTPYQYTNIHDAQNVAFHFLLLFLEILSIYLPENEQGRDRGRGRRGLPAERGWGWGAPSRDAGVMT